MISAIVLAAGESARLGRCKQLIRLGEKTILEHVLALIAQSSIDDVIVVLGAHADEIREHIQFAAQRIVMNPDYARGMSGSIRAGLRAVNAKSTAAMFVLGDLPFVTPQTIDRLVDAYLRSRPSIVIPTYRGARGNPVIVDRSMFARMMEIAGDVGFRTVFDQVADAILEVPVDDVGIVTDIDTQQDLDEATGH